MAAGFRGDAAPEPPTLIDREDDISDRHSKKRATMARNLEAATGRTVAEWVATVDASGLVGFREIVDGLKREHALGHFRARLVAEAHRDR